jgi:hypothetical protein
MSPDARIYAMLFKSPRGWGMLLLGIFLILWGVAQLGVIDLQLGWFDAHKLAAGVAIAAGVLLLLNR